MSVLSKWMETVAEESPPSPGKGKSPGSGSIGVGGGGTDPGGKAEAPGPGGPDCEGTATGASCEARATASSRGASDGPAILKSLTDSGGTSISPDGRISRFTGGPSAPTQAIRESTAVQRIATEGRFKPPILTWTWMIPSAGPVLSCLRKVGPIPESIRVGLSGTSGLFHGPAERG